MVAKFQDKIIFGIALSVLLATAGWVAVNHPRLAARIQPLVEAKSTDQYVPAGIDAPQASTMTWVAPAAQTRGPLWIYDVFTPPEIYYNAATKEFTVTPPVSGPPPPPPPIVPFGVELVQVKPDVFCLQLVGYVGNTGDYRGTFENTITGETLLARTGKKIRDLGLTVLSFEVKRNRIESTTSMPIYDTVATAVVVDDKTGTKVTLTNKARFITGEPFAVIKTSDSQKTFEQKAGTSFDVGDAHYTIRAITVEPASVEITKEAPDLKTPETKTLLISAPAAPAQTPAKPVAPPESVVPGAPAFLP